MIAIDKLNKATNEELDKLILANQKKIKSLKSEIGLFEKLKKANAENQERQNSFSENQELRF